MNTHFPSQNIGPRRIKRCFDFFISLFGIILLIIPLIILITLATISTGKFGLYSQERIGLNGKPFTMFKIRSLKGEENASGITLENDERITSFGRFLRTYRLDELPQLLNVFDGSMSLVGPRPDIKGYADQLKGEDRLMLEVRPGITGPATLKYRNEEKVLSQQKDPETYNREIIWKDKVKINVNYVKNWTLKLDLKILFKTFFN